MLNTLRQSHLEYLAKVLGAKSLVVSGVARAAEPVDLLVLVPRQDSEEFADLFGKVLAAWELPAEKVQVLLTEGAEPGPLPAAVYVLVFSHPIEAPESGWIYAGSLKDLEGDQHLKRKLWQQIKAAKAQLSGDAI